MDGLNCWYASFVEHVFACVLYNIFSLENNKFTWGGKNGKPTTYTSWIRAPKKSAEIAGVLLAKKDHNARKWSLYPKKYGFQYVCSKPKIKGSM